MGQGVKCGTFIAKNLNVQNVQDESLHGEEESLVTIRPVHSLLQNTTFHMTHIQKYNK